MVNVVFSVSLDKDDKDDHGEDESDEMEEDYSDDSENCLEYRCSEDEDLDVTGDSNLSSRN